MIRFVLSALILLSSSTASAIVIRDDVDDAQYRIPVSAFPALADMPGEGHGVLIAPQWVVTAAHTLPWHSGLTRIEVGGTARDVERVVIHPGYSRPPDALIRQALATGEWALAVLNIGSNDDIALIKLAQPVADIVPVDIYWDGDELGQTVKIVGKGATGNGVRGHDTTGPNRSALRRAFNVVSSAHERWFCYVFDAPGSALALEGKSGSGDSGGPALVQVGDQWKLAGLAAWGLIHGDVRVVPPGLYGQFSCNVRLGHYRDWIEGVLARETEAIP